MTRPIPITVAVGDGVGPELMDACLGILNAAGAGLAPEFVIMGQLCPEPTGISDQAWESLVRTGVFYKAPLATPQGGGAKSANVAVREAFGLAANLRPLRAYTPFLPAAHPALDIVVIRENAEDMYGGAEYRPTADVRYGRRIATAAGSRRVVRFAFAWARRAGRRRIACFSKDNIAKLTDGLFHRIFAETAAEYPDIEAEHLIVDAGFARLVRAPDSFDVVVAQNLYGDVLADTAAQMAGSVGLMGSANVGPRLVMFEAGHGTAPRRAGQDMANPSGLLLAGVMMLRHLGRPEAASRVHNAWLTAAQDGIHTYDVAGPATRRVVGTAAFARAVIERLGRRPRSGAIDYAAEPPLSLPAAMPDSGDKCLAGADAFIDWPGGGIEDLAARARAAVAGTGLRLASVEAAGVSLWPAGRTGVVPPGLCRCRFLADGPAPPETLEVLVRLHTQELAPTGSELLFRYGGEPGWR